MQKKILSLALALAMCLGLIAVPAAALNPGEEWVGDFVVNGSTLVKYYGESGAVTIPDGITTIGGNAFQDCTGLTSVTIPNSVTNIRGSAFQGCTGLTSITIPSSVTSIGGSAFRDCTGLTSVNIPNGVTAIEDSTFYNCTNLKSVTIPSSVTIIKNVAFQSSGLTNVTIPNGVTSIEYAAFSHCANLTSVTIPDSVTRIAGAAFINCKGLTNVTIPNSVTTIGLNAFEGCEGLTSLTIPSSVTTLEQFGHCDNLKSLTILSGDVRIPWLACKNLTDIYYIGSKAQWKERGGEQSMSTSGINPTIHYNSTGAGGAQPTTPTQPQQPAGSTASNGAQVSGWAKDRVNVALDNALAPDGLGNDYRVNITRAQFAATAVKLYEAMSGQKAEATGESSFTDTTDPVILLAADLGFVSGVGGGKFSPDALVTREQAAVMLSSVYTRLGGEIPAVASTTFADNGDVSGWAKSAVAFMNGKEIVTGVGNNSFSPKGNASIEQALLISLKMFETLK